MMLAVLPALGAIVFVFVFFSFIVVKWLFSFPGLNHWVESVCVYVFGLSHICYNYPFLLSLGVTRPFTQGTKT